MKFLKYIILITVVEKKLTFENLLKEAVFNIIINLQLVKELLQILFTQFVSFVLFFSCDEKIFK